ncbi:MAG: rhodanese-like domain-containing protein [Dehalococcoidia bacterium]
MPEYASPELLVETEWLAEHLDDPNVVVVEVAQDSSEFEAGHIPGARIGPDWQIKGSVDKKLVAPPDEAKAWMESVGIGSDKLVIGYDRSRNRDAARLWWVLSYYGHTEVKVLNGGWKRWSDEGRAVASGPAAAGGNVSFTPKSANDAIVSTVDKLMDAIGKPDAVIWDIRSKEEFDGEVDRGNARKGHVPGATHLEWTELVDEDHRFKSADELWALVGKLGITPESKVHVY